MCFLLVVVLQLGLVGMVGYCFSRVANHTWGLMESKPTLLAQPYLHARPHISTFLPTSMWQIHTYINLPDKLLTLIFIPYISEFGATDTSLLDLIIATLLNKPDSPSPRCHHLFLSPQLRVELINISPIPVRIKVGLIFCRSSTGNHRDSEFISTTILSYSDNVILLLF